MSTKWWEVQLSSTETIIIMVEMWHNYGGNVAEMAVLEYWCNVVNLLIWIHYCYVVWHFFTVCGKPAIRFTLVTKEFNSFHSLSKLHKGRRVNPSQFCPIISLVNFWHGINIARSIEVILFWIIDSKWKCGNPTMCDSSLWMVMWSTQVSRT